MRLTIRDLLDVVGVMLLGIMACALILIAAGCSGARPVPLPPVDVRTVTVNVPIATPCVDGAQIPVAPPAGLPLTGDAAHDAGLIAAQDLMLRQSLGIALALLGACTTTPAKDR